MKSTLKQGGDPSNSSKDKKVASTLNTALKKTKEQTCENRFFIVSSYHKRNGVVSMQRRTGKKLSGLRIYDHNE